MGAADGPLATQTLVILIIRTGRVPFFRSRASVPMLLAVLAVVAAGTALPFTPEAHVLGFRPLPSLFFLALAGIFVCHLALIEVGKYWFFRLYHAPARPGAPDMARRAARGIGGGLGAGILCLTAAASVAGCGSPHAPATPGVVTVVAGENFWGNIAAQIGGRHVRVTSILSSPAADPHLYESDVADAIAVAEARLVIENGAGYDVFLSQLLGVTTQSGRVVITVQQVLGANGPHINPHFWYDIPRIPEAARAIEKALVRLEPSYAAYFAARLAAFDRSLGPVLEVLQAIRNRYLGAPVAYTERLPGYFLQAAGLRVLTPAGFAAAIEDGEEPSPADTVTMDQLLVQHRVRALLYNAQAVSPVTQRAKDLARQAGVPVLPITETMPPAFRAYQAWQLAQATALLRALGERG